MEKRCISFRWKVSRSSLVLLVGLGYAVLSFGQGNISPFVFPPQVVEGVDYLPNKVIFKLTEKSASAKNNDVDEQLSIIGLYGSERKFPTHKKPSKGIIKQGKAGVDLTHIYQSNVPEGKSLTEVINQLYATGLIEYAVPVYLPHLLYTPNDPAAATSQFYLSLCHILDGWAIHKGDTSMVIAISDTGTDILHPDLAPNIKYNYDDVIDGIDNDNDGYIDNYRGWDIGENDNNPQYNKSAHGVHVCGIAGAATDNGTGMSGTGFKCKFLPIKIDDATGKLSKSYESIIYAADHGAKVINCSWGQSYYPGKYYEDIVNYAVINKDALVVAAAGNNGNEGYFYPASFDNVLSVAASTSLEEKWEKSNYNESVDVIAPGLDIYSTWANGTYLVSGGTSMASPLVAGMAGIIRSYYPSYSALQILEKIKGTTDIIDTSVFNLPYAGKLGTGRVNLHKALTDSVAQSIHFLDNQLPIEEYQNLSKGDTLKMIGSFINYLAPSSNINITLTSVSPYVDIIQGNHVITSLTTNQLIKNTSNPFKIKLKQDIPLSYSIPFVLTISTGTYEHTQAFSVVVNIDYITFQHNKIKTTLTSKGNLGYNKYTTTSMSQGVGLLFDNSSKSILPIVGIMVGQEGRVSDNVYGATIAADNDFLALNNVYYSSTTSPYELHSQFSDSLAEDKMHITLDNRVRMYDPEDQFILMDYVIKNTGQSVLDNVRVGLYADWDIEDEEANRADYDKTHQLGYVYALDGGVYGGISLINQPNAIYYALDNDGTNGSITIDDGFLSGEKFVCMKTQRSTAGLSTYGKDVSHVLSSGPYHIAPNDSIHLIYSLLVGYHLSNLKEVAKKAYEKIFPDTLSIYAPIEITKNPLVVNPSLVKKELQFMVQAMNNQFVSIDLVDVMGGYTIPLFQGVIQQEKHSFSYSIEGVPAGVYLVRLQKNASETWQSKVVIIP